MYNLLNYVSNSIKWNIQPTSIYEECDHDIAKEVYVWEEEVFTFRHVATKYRNGVRVK